MTNDVKRQRIDSYSIVLILIVHPPVVVISITNTISTFDCIMIMDIYFIV